MNKKIELKIENIKCIAYNGKTIEFSIKLKNLNKTKKEKLLEIACKEKCKKIILETQD